MSPTTRLADLLGALSVVCDLGFGLPQQQAMRAALVATALGREAGLDEEDVQAAFYTSLLMHIGCISMSHETADIFGNELALTRAVAMTNLGDPDDIVTTLIPEITRGMNEAAAEEAVETVITHAPTFGAHYDTTSAEVGRRTAHRIGLPERVATGLYQVSEKWQGGGAPEDLKGESISIAARLARLASDAAFFHHVGGVGVAVEAVRARSGTLHDPGLAKTFEVHADRLLADCEQDDPVRLLLEREPGPTLDHDESGLLAVATAVGDAADLKTPYTHGHARSTAEVIAAAAEHAGIPAEEALDMQVAASLRDVGRVAVSDAVWEKAGPLSSADWEEVRMHAYHAERVLTRSARLQALARWVGMHHERLDGSGYHRGSASKEIGFAARLIGVADAWVAMQQPRPHRSALEPDRAAAELSKEADAGRFDPRAVEAVLAASGRTVSIKSPRPGGLSAREVEVLRLLASGRSNPEIAADLHISARTAEHHVQHIYTKIGVSTRPAATLFALEHDLLQPLAS